MTPEDEKEFEHAEHLCVACLGTSVPLINAFSKNRYVPSMHRSYREGFQEGYYLNPNTKTVVPAAHVCFVNFCENKEPKEIQQPHLKMSVIRPQPESHPGISPKAAATKHPYWEFPGLTATVPEAKDVRQL